MKKAAKDVRTCDVIKIDIGGALFPCFKKSDRHRKRRWQSAYYGRDDI